jgi:hypothetical protein
MKYKVKIRLLLIVSLFCSFQVFSQVATPPYDSLFKIIKHKIQKGELSVLKDLNDLMGSKDTVIEFLGYHQLRHPVSQISERFLEENFIFSSETEQNSVLSTQASFTKYLFENEGKIFFSEQIQAFMLKPIEARSSNYRLNRIDTSTIDSDKIRFDLRLKQIQDDLRDADEDDEDDEGDALKEIYNLAKLCLPEAEKFIKTCFTPEFYSKYKFKNKPKLYEIAALGLEFYPSEKNISLIVDLKSKGILNEKLALSVLEDMTNIPTKQIFPASRNVYKQLLHCIDSLKTLKEMRKFGYKHYFEFSINDFNNPADYYGKILNLAWDYPLGKSALWDLLNTKDPVVLKYLAAIVYQHRSKWNDYHFDDQADYNPVSLIEKLTSLKVSVLNEHGGLVADYSEYAERLNYATYWNNHFSDYQWNESIARFVNIRERVEATDYIESLFLRLNSDVDSVASNAYVKIADLSANEVNLAIKKQDKLLESASSKHFWSIPMFPSKRLPAQASLYEFCRKMNIAYKPTPSLLIKLNSFNQSTTFAETYRQENVLIDNLNLSDITAVEYWGSISGENSVFSIGRILDKFYTNHFEEITGNEMELRLYLKKATVYNHFGIIGACGKYLWKFTSCSPAVWDSLKALKKRELDSDILTAIDELLSGNFNKSQCTGNVEKLYKDSISTSEVLQNIRLLKDKNERAGKYYDLIYNDYFRDFVEAGQLSSRQLKAMIHGLKDYIALNKDDSFRYSYTKSYITWIENINQSFGRQVESAQKPDAGKEALDYVVLSARYKEIPQLLNLASKDDKKNKYFFVKQHLSKDLAIPVDEFTAVAMDTILRRFNRLPEKEFYKSYLYDLGYRDLANGSIDFDRLYNMLEYDAVDGFVGGGGGRRSISAYPVIRFLELEFGTQLGFHWRMYMITGGTIRNAYPRSCAWMKVLRDKSLAHLPEKDPGSWSN